MEILTSIILYLLVVALFIAFGKFLKECDDSMSKGMNNETTNRNRRHTPAR
jgi:hypothetical protein